MRAKVRRLTLIQTGGNQLNAPLIDKIPHIQLQRAHLAIHPYPAHLEREWTLPDGQTVCIRPIRPEDAEL